MRWGAVALLLALASLGATRADDYGPARGLREVRAALPVLLARRLHFTKNTAAVATVDVVVDKDRALASWTAGDASGLVYLEYRLARWWMKGEANRLDSASWSFEPAGSLPLCQIYRPFGPTSSEITAKDLGVPADLAGLAAAHIAMVQAADGEQGAFLATHPHGVARYSHCDPANGPAYMRQNPATEDDYQGLILEPPSTLGDPLAWTFHGRAPSDGEMNGAGSDAIFFFSRDVDGTKGLSFPAHTRLDIWCPFVLDPEVRYSLTLVGGDPIVGPIDGTMTDNTMRFDLPAFTAAPGAELRGEIDWLPPHRR